MPKEFRTINLLLPEGLPSERYHALARRLVAKLTSAHIKSAHAGKEGNFLLLSEIEGAPPEGAAVLNDSTWTLTMPVPADLDAAALSASVESVAGGDAVKMETTPNYRTE